LKAVGRTNTYGAFSAAYDLLCRELPNQQGKPAPLVCHLTDGDFTDNDPEPVALEMMKLANDDGNVLVENIFIGKDLLVKPIADAATWKGVHKVDDLKAPYAKKLFRMSSSLPKSYCENILKRGYSLEAGSRMLLPCNNSGLLELAFATSGATPTK
jgi:hypothetical protein